MTQDIFRSCFDNFQKSTLQLLEASDIFDNFRKSELWAYMYLYKRTPSCFHCGPIVLGKTWVKAKQQYTPMRSVKSFAGWIGVHKSARRSALYFRSNPIPHYLETLCGTSDSLRRTVDAFLCRFLKKFRFFLLFASILPTYQRGPTKVIRTSFTIHDQSFLT